MRSCFQTLGILLISWGSVAFAAGGGSETASAPSPELAKDPIIRAAKAGIAKQDWIGTQELLKKAIASNPGNADYHNLYAFTTRKGPAPDMVLVLAEYAQALRLDPKHRGAHEYLGEAYLQINELAKAKLQLAALDKLCSLGCEEYSDLKRSIQQYEAAHPL